MPNGHPTFWLIAGPNGIGKTTFAMRRLEAISGSINFVNLDEIARGLSPLRPEAAQRDAARIALERAHGHIARRETFSMETTLSGAAHLSLLAGAAAAGTATALMFFSARDVAICIERVARRVAEGGHDVAENLVRRRFERGLANLPRYAPRCDLWRLYDAGGPRPRLAAEGSRTALRHADPEMLALAHPRLASFVGSLTPP